MAKVYTYPHWETNVIDNSIYTPIARETLPLFRPIFFMRAQQGPVGVPTWVYTSNEATDIFGEGTFDSTTKYFSREALYLNDIFTRQGAFIVRLADEETASYGSMVLELTVKKALVTQYEVDANGQFVYELDEDGNVVYNEDGTKKKVPVTNGEGAEVTEDGYELKWTSRPLDVASGETLANLKPTTYGSGGNAYTTYPIIAVKASSLGAYANDVGIKLYVDTDNLDDVLANNVSSTPYTFGIVKKTYGQDTVSAVTSIFGNKVEDFVFKPDQTDSRVARKVSFTDVIETSYTNLPFEVKTFVENVETVGKLIQAVEGEDVVTDPYLVNLTDAYDIDDVPYAHVVMSEDVDAIDLNSSRILYMTDGADGDIDDATIEELTAQYLRDLPYPEILDQPRYPFTHIIDTGVAIDTKYAFIQFLGVHDAFKLVLATQNANMGRFNTKAEDLSAGSALYAKCLLQPESVVKGTEVCRAEIYEQAGYLADNDYRGVVASTFDICGKKSLYASTRRITGIPAGLPSSEVSVFSKWNWTPSDADLKQKSWDSGLNYFQHYDMTSIHWPAMHTVYRYDTSVLSSATFTDAVVYTKHIARYNWSKYAGVEMPFSTLSVQATADLTSDLTYMLNNRYKVSVEFTQSDEEARIGYIAHAIISLTGYAQQRVWKIDIECNRDGFGNEE